MTHIQRAEFPPEVLGGVVAVEGGVAPHVAVSPHQVDEAHCVGAAAGVHWGRLVLGKVLRDNTIQYNFINTSSYIYNS